MTFLRPWTLRRFRGYIQINIASNLAMIKTQNIQHECMIYLSTCNTSNKAKLNHTFRDDPLSLILE